MFKKLQKKIERQKDGKLATKFRFEVIVKSVSNIKEDVGACRVVWSRGAKLQMTQIQPIQNGVAHFQEAHALQILASIYRDAKGEVEAKPYSVKVQYPVKGDTKNMQTLAKVQLDMARYAGVGSEQHEETLKLICKDGKSEVIVQALIISNIMKNADVDGMTEISGITGVSSDFNEADLGSLPTMPSLSRRDTEVSAVALHEENDKLKEEIASLKQEVEYAKNLEAQKNEVMEDNEQLRMEIEALYSKVSEIQRVSNEEKKKLVQEHVEAAQAEGNLAEAEILRIRAELENELSIVKVDLDSSNYQRKELKERVNVLQSDNDKLKSQNTQLETKLQSSRKAMEESEHKILSLSSQLEASGNSESELVKELQKSISDLNQKLKDARLQSEQLKLSMDEKNKFLQDRQKQIGDLELSLKTKEEELSNQKSKADKDLQEAYRQLETERVEKGELERQLQDRLNNDYVGEAATKEAVEMAVAAKEAKYRKLKEQYDQEVEQYNQDRLEFEESILDLQTQLQYVENARSNLDQEKQGLELALQDTAGERLELERERGELEKELARQRKQLNDSNSDQLEKENGMLIQALATAKLQLAETSEQVLLLRKEVHRKSETNMLLASKLTKMEAQVYKKRSGK